MLIFLDIDGVMVPSNSWKKPELMSDGFPVFSPKATKALNKVISEVKADIILTTSHKSNYTSKQWLNIFDLRGIHLSNVSQLPDNTGASRKNELMNWFVYHGIPENFVIIDDDKSLNALPESLKERLILTSGLIGFTENLAEEAIALLKCKSSHISV